MALREKLQMNEGSLLMFLKPKYFDMVILCTKDLGGFSYQRNEGGNVACFTTPSLPLKNRVFNRKMVCISKRNWYKN